MPSSPTPRAVVLMGVSGSGKTAVGTELSKQLGSPFLDADDFHPAANKEKMHRGEPLTDEDRLPWLETLNAELRQRLNAGQSVILACSALKESYRKILHQDLANVIFVYLKVDRAVLERRLAERKGHFFPKSLLDSQLATLEDPHDAVVVDENREIPEVVADLIQKLGLAPAQ
jgi:gluconokinase